MPDSQLRILLVEDNDGDADLVQEYVDEVGQGKFIIRRGKTLAEGMAVLSSNYDPQVMLLDLNLPDSKGLDTLEAFCAMGGPGRRSPPIVVLTSLDDQDTATKALASCAQDYLVKQDISGKTLVRSIRNAVQRQSRKAVEELMAEPKPDPADAIQVIRQVNRTGPTQLADRPVKDIQADVGELIEHQATALRAGEILFSQQDQRLRQLEQDIRDRMVTQERVMAGISQINDKLEPLLKVVRGNGRGPLVSRLDALERVLGDEQDRQESKPGFRWPIILGMIVLVLLGGVGSLIISLMIRALGTKP